MSGGQRPRSVEIIGKSSIKFLRGLSDSCSHLRLLAGGEFFLLQPVGKVAQPFDSAGGLLQAAEGEVQLLAIWNAGQGKAHGRRLVAFSEKIAQREEVAERLGHL